MANPECIFDQSSEYFGRTDGRRSNLGHSDTGSGVGQPGGGLQHQSGSQSQGQRGSSGVACPGHIEDPSRRSGQQELWNLTRPEERHPVGSSGD